MPHANTVQLEEPETEAGPTRDKGGNDEQWVDEEEGEGGGPKQDKAEGDGSEGNVSEGKEFEHMDREGDEYEVVHNIVEGGHEIEENDAETDMIKI